MICGVSSAKETIWGIVSRSLRAKPWAATKDERFDIELIALFVYSALNRPNKNTPLRLHQIPYE